MSCVKLHLVEYILEYICDARTRKRQISIITFDRHQVVNTSTQMEKYALEEALPEHTFPFMYL